MRAREFYQISAQNNFISEFWLDLVYAFPTAESPDTGIPFSSTASTF